ncbi:MAG: hypothetical protein EA411_08825 [Saprospirales bacterium]|nr:MAG: hypothetical protein EA411_08825 [Saprospirales bacterium]
MQRDKAYFFSQLFDKRLPQGNILLASKIFCPDFLINLCNPIKPALLRMLATTLVLAGMTPALHAHTNNSAKKEIVVLATSTIIADIASQLAGDYAKITSLVPRGQDPHNFDPGPSDLVKISNADLILLNGMQLETWLVSLIRRSGRQAAIDTVTRGIDPIYTGQYEASIDPHAWLDPVLGKTYVKNIAASLKEQLPGRAGEIEAKRSKLLKELEQVHLFTEERISSIPEEERILITSHDAFRYFGDRYQLRVESVFPTSADAEITIKDMAELNNLIRKTEVKAIFPESTINPRLVRQLASDNRITLGGKLYTDSLGEKDGEAGDYISLLYHNTSTIFDGLTGQRLEAKEPEQEVPLILTLVIVALLLGSFFIMWHQMDLGHGKKDN